MENAGNCTLDINPDVVCDFTSLPFTDNLFQMVFDPPHLTGAKETAWLVKKYGKLDDNWPQMIHDGFRECMRVLKPDGVLISNGQSTTSQQRMSESHRAEALVRTPQWEAESDFLGLLYEVGGDGDAGGDGMTREEAVEILMTARRCILENR